MHIAMLKRFLYIQIVGQALPFRGADGRILLTSNASGCQYRSTLTMDRTFTSTSAPALPPSLRQLQDARRPPRSSIICAVDKQLHENRFSTGDDTDDKVPDGEVPRLLVGSNGITRANLDTLRLLQRYNSGMSLLRGHAILAKVLNVDGMRVLVDTGFAGISEVPRSDVTVAHVLTADGQLPVRLFTTDVRPGDLLRLRVDCVYTPYGDTQLSAIKVDIEQQRRVIWGELQRRMEQQKLIGGRVLNECPGGFAVGVAGFVASLPAALAATATAKLVGVRQEFQIIAMDSARQRITLRDPRLQR
ncbi:hypothetical protein Vretimale_2728 [Volvox reticuliferus]|uniref:S1 motif domain-containing protein n=1 Tax=Volvox reticuliferus TaxID=1737510 RepID=A0A8J4D730_9CHLO|nr:hypothetical protein Vretimale_2728 [Volvox reticuliferus]